jgi:hypothetical protein
VAAVADEDPVVDDARLDDAARARWQMELPLRSRLVSEPPPAVHFSIALVAASTADIEESKWLPPRSRWVRDPEAEETASKNDAQAAAGCEIVG